MAEFKIENENEILVTQLLNIYNNVMYLKIYVDNEPELKKLYLASADNHNKKLSDLPQITDAGFDLFTPGNKDEELNVWGKTLRFFGVGWGDFSSPTNKVDYKICCSAKMITTKDQHTFNTGFYMYPRSSLSKTKLRLANSVGIIDAGYRGHLMAIFDVANVDDSDSTDKLADYFGEEYDRYIQICAPGLAPIIVEIVDTKEDLGEKTKRGDGGFGSTGR